MNKAWRVCVVMVTVLSAMISAPARAQDQTTHGGWTSNPFRNEGSNGNYCIRPTTADWGSGVQLDLCPEFFYSNGTSHYPADADLWWWHIEAIGTANGVTLLRVSNNRGLTDGSTDGQGLCLEGDGTSDWTPVIVNGCYHSSSNQYWYWYTSGTYKMLRNYHTGFCLDLRNGGYFVGNVIQTYHCAPNVSPSGAHNTAQFWTWDVRR